MKHLHPMSTFEKSKHLWLGGAAVGAIVGAVVSARGATLKGTLGGAALGSIFLGVVGDKVLERDQYARAVAFAELSRHWKR